MITRAIKSQFEIAMKRGWDKIYVVVDLHGTVLKPDYNRHELLHDYYPGAKELLQELSERKDVCLIMYTCSHPDQIEFYLENFERDGIHFEHVNKNPEVKTDHRYGYYEDKPYMNILMDDKAGFSPEEDIEPSRKLFKQYSL